MKHLSLKAMGPALAIAAILSLGACTMPQVQGCDMNKMNCCAKMQCCKMKCGKTMKNCCCCGGNGKAQGCPYTPKPKLNN